MVRQPGVDVRARWVERAGLIGAVLSLAIGLIFVFVRAPHPWGWEGFDGYRDLGLGLARGEGFPTMERLWGYPLFLAACYAAFGDRPWVPLVLQVALNAIVPLLVFHEARRRFDPATAAAAALLTGVVSFNTLYASTQSADALCTVAFVAAVVLFSRAADAPSPWRFAASGVCAGLALSLRPNLLLFPVFAVAVDLMRRRGRGWRASHALVFLVAAGIFWAPWAARNLLVSGRVIPATTRGGIQLWYGSLQTGPYFERWFDNPRAQHEPTAFDYSLPTDRPTEIVVSPGDPGALPLSVSLTYWTNRSPHRETLEAPMTSGRLAFTLPPIVADTVLYYTLEGRWRGAGDGEGEIRQSSPLAGSSDPFRHVITDRHFDDLDLAGATLDVFDVMRLIRHLAWQTPLSSSETLADLDDDGRVTDADLDIAASTLVAPFTGVVTKARGAVARLDVGTDRARLVLSDGSSVAVPRAPRFTHDRTLDIAIDGNDMSQAANLVRSVRSVRSLAGAAAGEVSLGARYVLRAEVNKAFWRAQPLWMDRYNAMARENLRDAPLAAAVASGRRLLRMFYVLGSEDRYQSAQFEGSRFVYLVASAASISYALLFGVGVVLAWRRGCDCTWLLCAIAYVPLTITLLLPNMRYTVTAQPLVLMFVAVTIVALLDAMRGRLGRVPR